MNAEALVSTLDEEAAELALAVFQEDGECQALQEDLERLQRELDECQAQLRAARTQAVESERLCSLGAMVNGVAHEFNSSLWMILGYGELLQQLCRTKTVPPEFSEYVGTIVSASLEAVETVTRLSDFEKPDAGASKFAQIDLAEVIERAVRLTRPRWQTETRGRGLVVDVITDLQPAKPILGASSDLCEMFTNLILNAVDAMPQGGNIELRTRMSGGRVEVTFCDTGVGMSSEVRRRCLDPFFTTKGGSSSGVGLAVVNATVERHGGTVRIESTRGCGVTFFLSFPPAPAVLDGQRPLRILAVDDHPVQTELLAHALGGDRHIVETVSNGRDAIERFDSEYFDLVITDQSMPGMSGDQLAAAIKAREPSTPVIMLTGLGRISEEEEPVSEFVDLLIAKPAALRDLQAAIAKVTS